MQKLENKGLVPSHEEQIEWLRVKLNGNRNFQIAQGVWNRSFSDSVYPPGHSQESPPQFKKRLDEIHGAVQAIGVVLKQLERDGWLFAFHALVSLLHYPGYPLQFTKSDGVHASEDPRVLLVPNVKLLYDLMQSVHAGRHQTVGFIEGLRWLESDCYLAASYLGPQRSRAHNTMNLWHSGRRFHASQEVRDLLNERGMDLLNGNGLCQDETPLAYCVEGVSKAELLKKLGRQRIKYCKLALWSFPKTSDDSHYLTVMVYPATLHAQARRLVGVIPSTGCVNGFGACLVHFRGTGTDFFDQPDVLRFNWG